MRGYNLPTSIEIGGIEYPITNCGDYKMVLDCFSLLNDEEILKRYRYLDCLKIFYKDINSDYDVVNVFGNNVDEALSKCFSFFNCNQLEVPRKGAMRQLNLVDWEQDEQLICAAILDVAGVDIRSLPFLHWFTFYGYYMSIKPDSVFGTVINLRSKRALGKKIEKHELEFINNNPQYFKTKAILEQEKADEEWFNSVWGK